MYDVVTKPAFELFVFGLICLNMVALGCEHYKQSDKWIKALLYADIVFTALFLIGKFKVKKYNKIIRPISIYRHRKSVSDWSGSNLTYVLKTVSECVVKIIGLRAYYFRDPFNVFDFIVIMLSAIGLILENLLAFFVSPTLLRVVRVFRYIIIQKTLPNPKECKYKCKCNVNVN